MTSSSQTRNNIVPGIDSGVKSFPMTVGKRPLLPGGSDSKESAY